MNNPIQAVVFLTTAALGVAISPAWFGVTAGCILILLSLLQRSSYATNTDQQPHWHWIPLAGIGLGVVLTSPRAFASADTAIAALQWTGNMLIIVSGLFAILTPILRNRSLTDSDSRSDG